MFKSTKKPTDARKPTGEHCPALREPPCSGEPQDRWFLSGPSLPYRSLRISRAVKVSLFPSSHLPQVTGPWHFCAHAFQVQRLTRAGTCAGAESFCLPGVRPVLSLWSRGCCCPTRGFPLADSTLLEGLTPGRSEAGLSLPHSGWVGSWHCTTVKLFPCLLAPSCSGDALSHPCMPPRKCRLYVNSTW